MREMATKPKQIRELVRETSTILGVEATRDLEVATTKVVSCFGLYILPFDTLRYLLISHQFTLTLVTKPYRSISRSSIKKQNRDLSYSSRWSRYDRR